MAIDNQNDFQDWLLKQTRGTCVLIAVRATLRVFPYATHYASQKKKDNLVVLLTARAALISAVAAKTPTPRVVAATNIAADAAAHAITNTDTGIATSEVAYAAANAAHAVINASAVWATDAATNATFRLTETAAGPSAATHAAGAAYSDTNIGFEELLQTPLWNESEEPQWLISTLITQNNLLETGPEWSFWREWYQGFLDGKPLDWELQRRVALIDDAIWEAGPEAVADEIERIRAGYEVEIRAAEIEQSAYPHSNIQSVRGMGDNNPPSSIDDAVETSNGVTIIWAAAQELKEQAQSQSPNKARARKAVSAIVGVLRACGLWAAKKIDKGLDAAVIAACAAGGTAGVAWITQNADKIQELIDAAQKWLPFL